MTFAPPPATGAGEERAFEIYSRVRDEVRRLQAARDLTGVSRPGRYWTGELDNIDYLIEASPLVIRKLRHHAFHITGLRPYDYREHGDRQKFFERRLAALIELAGGSDLLVPESPALGGFGYPIDGRLYNVDTIKFFEAFVALRRAGLLEPFRASSGRRLVCEIGGGWGGFAYQFKTLFPDTTYVIVDFPELFLFSATYLSAVFPEARVRFWRPEGTFDRWEDADFVFVPNDRVEALAAVRPDLLVNLISFQEMTSAQVETYVRVAAGSGCRSIYSFNRDRSRYNDEIDSVAGVLSQQYDLREIRLLGSDYTKATKKDSALSLEEASRAGRVETDRYRHLAGTLASARGAREAAGGRPMSVAIGATLFNRAAYLAEALDSLLAQSYANFTLVLVDDGSTDGTEEIARAYARRDARVRFIRHAERRGMVAAWRSAFEYATADGAACFAWASDHDRWHRDWLATLVGVLEREPDVVLAYPLTQRVDPSGMPLAKPAKQFETAGMTGLDARWKAFSRSDAVGAGDMIYGVMRVDAMRAAGVFRETLCPDRLLIAELTLRGQIRQVPEVLWFRRQFPTGSVVRQRGTLFAPGTRPPSALTPPWYLHARSLWKTYGREGNALGVSRSHAARLVATYTAWYAWRHYGKTPEQRGVVAMLGRPRWMLKQTKHYVLLSLHGVLVAARYAGITPLVERVCERVTGNPRPWRGHA